MSVSDVNKSIVSVDHADPRAVRFISDSVITALPQHISQITLLCIGTDRSTGDSLGPMTGTLLNKLNPKLLNVQGTLANPVHALNLQETLDELQAQQHQPYIIALDASLGHNNKIGHIQTGSGSISPGSALKKELPAVGNAFITGVVNFSGMMEYSVLQHTRLSLVYNMAHTLAKTLFHIDLWLQEYQMNRLKQGVPMLKINTRYTVK